MRGLIRYMMTEKGPRMSLTASRVGRGAGRISTLVTLLAVMLSVACANAELSSDYNADGSATHSVEVQVDRSVLTLAPPELAAFDPEQIVQAARDRGFQAEEISTNDRIGVRIWRDVADSSDIGTTFNDILT